MKDSAKTKFRKIESKRKLASHNANAIAGGGKGAEINLASPSNEILNARNRTVTAEARKKMSIATLMNTVQLDDHGSGSTQRTILPSYQSVSQPLSMRLPPIKSLDLPLPFAKTLGADFSAALIQSSVSPSQSDQSEQDGRNPVSENVQPRGAVNEPSYTHPELLAMAILASPERRETHLQICIWISDQYPYYRHVGLANGNKSRVGKRFQGFLERNKLFKKHKVSKNKVLWSISPDIDCSGLNNKLRLMQKRTQTLDCSLPNPLPKRYIKKAGYGCLVCASLFAHRLDLEHHVATAHPRLHECDCHNCGGKLQPARLHDPSSEPVGLCRFFCNDCDLKFRLIGELVDHARKSGHSINEDYTKQELCKCAECGKSFVSNSSLQRHCYFSHHTGT